MNTLQNFLQENMVKAVLTADDIIARYAPLPEHTENCLAYKIPVEKLAEVQKAFRQAKLRVNYFFRGSRKTTFHNGYNRSGMTRQSICLKQDATYFTVYKRG